jgi:hypothetical protein
MKLNLKVTMTDGISHEVVAGVPDIVAWEQKFKSKVSDWSNGVGLSDMAFLTWNYLKRTNVTPLNYEQWLLGVEEIEASDADPKATPAEA